MSNLTDIYFLANSLCETRESYRAREGRNAANGGDFKTALEPTEILEPMARDRHTLAKLLINFDESDAGRLLKLDVVFEAGERIKAALYDFELTSEEKETLAQCKQIFLGGSYDFAWFRAFCVLSLYEQAFHLPVQKNSDKLPFEMFRRYLLFTMRQPHLMIEADEGIYVNYVLDLGAWFLALLKESDGWDKQRQQALIGLIKSNFAFGAAYYIDRPIVEILKLRGKLAHALTSRIDAYKTLKSFQQGEAFAPNRDKIKVGVLMRTVGDYTDVRATFSMLRGFDADKFSFVFYSLDKHGPIYEHDVPFLRDFYAFASRVVSLSGEGHAMAQTVLSDDLDIFIVATAFSFGVRDLDLMLSHRLARVQIGLNALIPSPSGFDSYDYYVTARSEGGIWENFRDECLHEKVIELDDPMIWYDWRPPTKPDAKLSREVLGIPKDAIVYCSGAAANKQMAGTLRCFFDIVRRVPNSYLVFYPFNPAWGGYFIALIFLARLRSLLKRDFADVDPSRIIVVRQLVPEEGDRIIGLSNICLGSFPHAGATTTMLSLLHRKPLVARRSPWIRGTGDESMVRALGFDELVADTNDDFITLAADLGTNPRRYEKIVERINAIVDHSRIFGFDDCSGKLQKLIMERIAETKSDS